MDTQTIILAVLASSGLWKLAEKAWDTIAAKRSAKNAKNDDHVKIEDLNNRLQEVNDKVNDLDSKMEDLDVKLNGLGDKLDEFIIHSNEEDLKQELASTRTQLMALTNHYPDNVQEILTVAHHYFVDLHGDWFYTGMFKQFCENNNIPIPDWFNH